MAVARAYRPPDHPLSSIAYSACSCTLAWCRDDSSGLSPQYSVFHLLNQVSISSCHVILVLSPSLPLIAPAHVHHIHTHSCGPLKANGTPTTRLSRPSAAIAWTPSSPPSAPVFSAEKHQKYLDVTGIDRLFVLNFIHCKGR